jgi:hypothetical protein
MVSPTTCENDGNQWQPYCDESCWSTTCLWIEGGVRKSTEFAYTLPFDNHFHYRHAVDDHNNLHHLLPSWEDTWVTQRWELCVLAFIIAVCEVNAYLAISFSEGKKKMPTLQEKIWMAVDYE